MSGSSFDASAWAASDFAQFQLATQMEGDIATRLAAVSEMMHAVIQEDLLHPSVVRYNELVDLLSILRNDRIRIAAQYGFDLVVEYSVTTFEPQH